MIVVGLVAHREPPAIVPQLDGVASLVVAVNARTTSEPTPWLGFGANHNRLMTEHGTAEWYVVLNPDVELSAEQLSALIEQADAHGYALVGPLRREPSGVRGWPTEELPTPGHFLRTTFRTSRSRRFRQALVGSAPAVADSPWVTGCCMAIRGDLMRELRFDERYFMYFEDTDICQRAHRLGARVGVCTTVTVDHASGWGRDEPLLARRGVEFARSALLYAKTYGHSPQMMRLSALCWALPRLVVLPRGSRSGRAGSRVFASGLVSPTRPGLTELAVSHNEHYGFALGYID
jgi:GT2 family glycosyltransferase